MAGTDSDVELEREGGEETAQAGETIDVGGIAKRLGEELQARALKGEPVSFGILDESRDTPLIEVLTEAETAAVVAALLTFAFDRIFPGH